MPLTIRRAPYLFFLLALVLTLVGAGDPGASAKPGKGGGGEAGPAQCRQGAWATLARSESSTVPFASQKDCSRYLAQGGVAVSLQAIPPAVAPPTAIPPTVAPPTAIPPTVAPPTAIPTTAATLVVTWGTTGDRISITGSGLQPGTYLSVTYVYGGSTESGDLINYPPVQSDGTVSIISPAGCGMANLVVTATTSAGGTISTDPSSSPCQPTPVPTVPPIPPPDDSDGDGFYDSAWDSIPRDNCTYIANPDQLDSNNNGLGDACEDTDGDGLSDAVETQLGTSLTNSDTDGDGWLDPNDNCPTLKNGTQSDVDADGIGDRCDDGDSDGDGLTDREETGRYDTNPTLWDTDGDGLSDGHEVNVLGTNPNNSDTDRDGYGDLADPNPLDPNVPTCNSWECS